MFKKYFPIGKCKWAKKKKVTNWLFIFFFLWDLCMKYNNIA